MGVLTSGNVIYPDNLQRKEDFTYERDAVVYSATGDTTATVTRDFICTGIYFWAKCGDNLASSSAYMDVTINGQLIRGCRTEAQANASNNESTYCFIPEWIIRKNTEINFNSTTTFGTGGANVIGYLLP